MENLYRSRFFGIFIAAVALDIALRSDFTFIALLLIGTPFVVVWFFEWDDEKYAANKKKTNKDGHPS
ncbi:hypothetical protein [Enterococcus faecalis]|uniref:hypothetical protein n=1 Tax=Enterococcus faecalis TaxID=1351 RepID=UPI000534C9E7|nr:hypothetical protein [Enterococcus faecalis]